MDQIPLAELFLTIFIGMGPIKVLLVYLGATQGVSKDLQRRVAQKTVVTASAVALLLLVAGVLFMRILHFTTGALNIAGGLILLLLALNLVLSPAEKEEHSAAPSEEALMSMAIYPMGMPLLLNPVGIVSLTVFSAETQDLLQLAIIGGMVLAVAVIDYGIFLVSHRLDRYLTHERIMVMEKLLGILLAAAAMQILYQSNPFVRLTQPVVAMRFATIPAGQASGWVIAAAATGSFIGSLIGGFLADSVGFNAINWMGAIAVGAAVLLLFFGLWPAERKKIAAEAA